MLHVIHVSLEYRHQNAIKTVYYWHTYIISRSEPAVFSTAVYSNFAVQHVSCKNYKRCDGPRSNHCNL